jgi:Flp pilus assembly protein TadB
MGFINYLKKILNSGSKESSKRFLALYLCLGLVTYVVIMFTNKDNLEMVLGELLAAILGLMGITAWEKNKMKDNEKL